MDEPLVCIVCGTKVPPDAAACATCDEPRVRFCRCSTLVTLDRRECPGCSRVVPRVLTLDVRRRRRWKRRIWWMGVAAVALAGAGVLAWPRVRDARRASSLLAEGEDHVAAGRHDAAYGALTELARIRPGDPRTMRLLALACFGRGQDDEGATWAQRALALGDPGAELHAELARTHLAGGDPHLALSHARAATEPRAAAIAARALRALGRLTEASEAFDVAIERAPDDLALRLDAADVRGRLGRADWAGAARERRREREALEGVAKLAGARLAAAPSDAAAAEAAALATARNDQSPPEETDAACRRAVTLRESPAVRTAWAHALLRAGRRADAGAALGPAPGRDAPAALLAERAAAVSEALGARAAERELREALAASPANVAVASTLARFLVAAGRADDALAVVGGARAAGSSRAAPLLSAAAEAALAKGDSALAERHLATWRECDPRDPAPLRALLDLRMPELLHRRRVGIDADERVRAATARMEDLAALDSGDATLLYWRCEWDDAAGRAAESDARIAVLLAQHPEEPRYRLLRIRRDCAAGPEPAQSVASEMAGSATVPATDLRAFAREALRNGRVHLLLDVHAARAGRGPADPVFDETVARALIALGRPAAAARLLDGSPSPVRATALALAGRLPEAAAIVARAERPEDRIEGARALCAGGDAAAAAEVLRGVAAREDDAATLAALAEAFEECGRTDEARERWTAAAAASQGDPALVERASAAAVLRAEVAEDDRALVAQHVDVLRARPDAAASVIALRGLFALAEGESAVAAGDLRRAVAGDPDRGGLRRALARAETASGDAAAAAAHLRALLRRDPACAPARREIVDVLVAQAGAALKAGQVSAALAALEEAALHGGTSPVARDALTIVPPPLPGDAAARLRATTGDDAARAGPLLVLALDAAARGAHDEADALALRVAEAAPEAAGGPLVRGVVRAAAGRTREASEDFAAAIGRGLAPASAAIAATLLTPGAPTPEAVDALKGAAAAAPADARLASALAAAQCLRGDDADALAGFESLLGRAPDEAARRDLHALGAWLLASGREDAARRALGRALLLDPDSPAAEASRAALSGLAR